MKLTATIILLVLGLVSATSFQLEDPTFEDSIGSTDEDLFDTDDLFGIDDLDTDDDSEMTFDEARAKWRLLRNMYMVLENMEESNGGIQKRFIGSWFKKVKEAVKKAAKKVGNFFKDKWNKAKAAFSKVTKKIDFKKVVNKLIPHIHSGMTVSACSAACTSAATAIFGPAALSAGVACGPVCNGALAKLEDAAG